MYIRFIASLLACILALSPLVAPLRAYADGALVSTGDAVGAATVTTTANTNAVQTGNASGTPQSSVAVVTGNNATTTSTVGVGASSGSNNASSSDTASITTGSAIAGANVLNVVNTTVTDSSGLILLLNMLFGSGIDLSSAFSSVFDPTSNPVATSSCSLAGCNQGGTKYSVTSTSTASVSNSVIVRADTGGNTASSTSGNATIQTGDAYAGANVVTLANTNIIQSNYLLISINNLGSLMGDITLPGKDFFQKLLGLSSGSIGGGTSISTTNTAIVANTIYTGADTGGNTASSTSGSSITTGNAQAASSVLNQVNTNLYGGTSLHILVRIAGGWSGNLFSLPAGLSWQQTAGGIEIFNTTEGTSTSGIPASTFLNTSNSASVHNNIQVTALTGDNRVSGNGAQIGSGNAQAASSIITIANTNVVGHNWILAILNIAGNWNGNLSFGKPDLWVGISATPGTVNAKEDIAYSVTISNRGNADATDVVLNGSYHNALMTIASDDDSTPGHALWHLGTIPAGATREYTYHAKTADQISYGNQQLPFSVTASEHETDANTADNTDSVIVAGQGTYVPSSLVVMTPDANLHLTKTASTGHIGAPGTVDYKMVVTNDGGPAYNATLYDTITDADGQIIKDTKWDLDTVNPGDEITVTYTALFATSTHPGLYTGQAQVQAISRNPSTNPFYGWFADSPIASTTLVVDASVIPFVPILASTSPVVAPAVCHAYLTGYLGAGEANDPAQVSKLQQFLKEHGAPDLVVTGVYDAATKAVVAAFQEAHHADILAPWGVPSATGYVYYTTRKFINDTMCAGGMTFPLSLQQQAEIDRFKSRYTHLPAGYPTPSTSKVGIIENVPKEIIASIEPPKLAATQVAAAAQFIAPVQGVLSSLADTIHSLFKQIKWQTTAQAATSF